MKGPLTKFRAGSVSCALWENEVTVNGKTVTMLKASVKRRYRDKDGNWKSSGSFGRNEIPLVIYCLEKAFEAIVEVGDVQVGSAEQNVRRGSVAALRSAAWGRALLTTSGRARTLRKSVDGTAVRITSIAGHPRLGRPNVLMRRVGGV